MKLEYTEGCVCTSLDVDGIEFNDMPILDQKSLCHQLIDHSTNSCLLQDIFIKFMENEGEYTDLGQCEECGDYISNYKYELK